MSKRSVVMLALVLAVPSALRAQDPQCEAQAPQLRDACQKAVDLYQYMAPQLGISLTGGNATAGQGGVLGGFGHFSVEVRGNGLVGSLPQVQAVTPSTSAMRSDTYGTKTQVLGLPSATVGIGLFSGIPLGLTNVGGLDAIVTGTYIPEVNDANVSVAVPSGAFKLGYGARLGILQESLLVPGVSVTYLRRDLPVVDITGNAGSTTLSVNGLTEKTDAWRVVASKNLVAFSLAVGAGQDKYTSSANVSSNTQGLFGGQTTTITVGQTLTRTNYFADLSLNLVVFRVVGEVGMVSGGSVPTYNQFDKAPDASRVFGSVGLRFGW
ncbi:MAG TPA: hypothetical protein VG818_06815 [Gemmatimonadaceae bacterium]|jgi:hypothetical protein|nr:hypothetical protein [Gemmatimonadaceae bacterium]